MLSIIGKFLFHLVGWKLEGDYPGNENSFVVIVAPHTSMWDVPIGICVKWWKKMNVAFYVKEEMFFFPISIILKGLNAIPIKRSGNTNFVFEVVKDFKTRRSHRILITPEGTRKKVKSFKTGYYFIAKGAGVPILPVIFDFENKTIIMKDLFYLTDDIEKDQSDIEDIYDGYKGKIPDFSFSKAKG
ncbi:MAG: 1-acyl-sn-glycerol-3-phosphate acyltransferase [Saprospiraceae bacterium]|nr:1-acyl-sn-glycerol-3-phosphate acyltransferase [Saprospiraceae bacterium]|tara:strand:+ start:1943 stop:2500 length:558 start_codon:yes stop_codon:yes gene_type:complete